jgi:2',3'-cyclic-nucleotide 2'-phosphodiesterase (5'-nucleotidase family)
MPNFPLEPDMASLPKYKIIEVKGKEQTRRIALIGLITEDPHVYKNDRFGNCIIEPVNQTAARLYNDIMTKEKVDAIIPLTHQLVELDRNLAKMKVGFPLILGGHDHDKFNEVVDGCAILKVGMDAETIGIVDLVWSSPSSIAPTVKVVEKPATAYPRDPTLEHLIKKHKYVIEQLVSLLTSQKLDYLIKSLSCWCRKKLSSLVSLRATILQRKEFEKALPPWQRSF